MQTKIDCYTTPACSKRTTAPKPGWRRLSMSGFFAGSRHSAVIHRRPQLLGSTSVGQPARTQTYMYIQTHVFIWICSCCCLSICLLRDSLLCIRKHILVRYVLYICLYACKYICMCALLYSLPLFAVKLFFDFYQHNYMFVLQRQARVIIHRTCNLSVEFAPHTHTHTNADWHEEWEWIVV